MKKIAVHLHLYYTEQLPQIITYLRNLTGMEYDLFVTLAEDNPDAIEQLKAFNPQVKIWQVANCGYDIGPFIDFLHHINLDDYEYILKLHTKGKKSKNYTWLNGRRMDNALWGRILWQSMLATSNQIRQNIQLLDENKKINMLGSKYCVTDSSKDYEKLLPQINEELVKMGHPTVNKLSFVAGYMFLVRAEKMIPLLSYTLADFVPTNSNVKEGTLAHIIELIFGVLGQEIFLLEHGKYTLNFYWVTLKRFLYQQKQTTSGHKVIKVCKIPIYKEG